MRGTESAEVPQQFREVIRWNAQQLAPEYEEVLAGWPQTICMSIPEVGHVLFCHATQRNDTDVFTKLTLETGLVPLFEGLGATLVICGHSHMQFDRLIGGVRVVNAGSVGMPFQDHGAYWLLLGPEVELRHTSYDLAKAAERIRNTKYPQAEDFAARNVLNPPSEKQMIESFSRVELR
jgi:hypothetical protein